MRLQACVGQMPFHAAELGAAVCNHVTDCTDYNKVLFGLTQPSGPLRQHLLALIEQIEEELK